MNNIQKLEEDTTKAIKRLLRTYFDDRWYVYHLCNGSVMLMCGHIGWIDINYYEDGNPSITANTKIYSDSFDVNDREHIQFFSDIVTMLSNKDFKTDFLKLFVTHSDTGIEMVNNNTYNKEYIQ